MRVGIVVRVVVAGSVLLFMSGCATRPPQPAYRATQSFQGYCAIVPAEMPVDANQGLQHERRTQAAIAAESGTLSRFSRDAIHTADAINALPLLREMVALETQTEGRDLALEVRLLKVRQRLTERISLAALQINRVAANAGCEEQRAHQLADRLIESQATRIRHLTLLGVLAGGLANILSGALNLVTAGEGGDIGSIAFGALGAAFGTAALYLDTDANYDTYPNLFREIWEAPPTSQLIPPSIWRFFNHPPLDEAHPVPTIREDLLAGWQQEGRLGPPGSRVAERRLALMLKDRGHYDADDLVARAEMMDMLQATVNIMHQRLEWLMLEILAHHQEREEVKIMESR